MVRDVLARARHERVAPGDVVFAARELARADDGLVIPFWVVRFIQGERKRRCFLQAVPVGVWPARLVWALECDLELTGLVWPMWSFGEQDRQFKDQGWKGQLAARKVPVVLRSAFEEERQATQELATMPVSYRGVPPEQWESFLRRRLAFA